VPVATVALDAAKNAGILAAEILGIYDEAVSKKIMEYKMQMKEEVERKAERMIQ
jgi:5-(carboxyamino)imidazole ribonucleotide mutase